MAANGRGNARPTGRSPPFLAIGLFVALVILGFNYWSLSARNGEQVNEIAVMESEIRLLNTKKSSAEKRSEAITDKLNEAQEELSNQKATLAEKIKEIEKLNRDIESLKSDKESLEGQRQSFDQEKAKCEEEKQSLTQQLQQCQEALETEKNIPKDTTCDESKCQEFVAQSRQKTRDDVLQEVVDVAGWKPLYNLAHKGKDVGKLASIVDQKYAEEVAILQQQQQQAQQQQGAQNPAVNQNIPNLDGAAAPVSGDVKADQSNVRPGQDENRPDGDDNEVKDEDDE